MSAAFTLVDRLPTVAEFQQLRESAGWTRVADDAVDLSSDADRVERRPRRDVAPLRVLPCRSG